MKRRHDLIVGLDYNVMHHDAIPSAGSVVSCKHDIILRQEQEKHKTRPMKFLVTFEVGVFRNLTPTLTLHYG